MFTGTWSMMAMCIISATFNSDTAKGDKVCTPLTKMRGPHRQGICGDRIDELLSLFCVHGHNELYPGKRKKRDISDDLSKQLQQFLIKREDANTYLMKRDDFHETGIVCECCYHQCDIPELFSYCKVGPDLFKRTVDKIGVDTDHD